MLATTNLDDRFLDRRGCGDELYADLNFRAAAWLAELHGEPSLTDDGLDLDLFEDADDVASH